MAHGGWAPPLPPRNDEDVPLYPPLPPKTRQLTAVDRLNRFGRQPVGVPVNGNSLFEAIAKQLDDPELDAAYLRVVATYQGLSNVQKYISSVGLTSMQIVKWRTSISDFKNDRHWDEERATEIVRMLSDALCRKIVVLRNEAPVMLVFGKDGQPVDNNTIMILEACRKTPEYHASKLMDERKHKALMKAHHKTMLSHRVAEDEDYEYVKKATDEWADFDYTKRKSTRSSASVDSADIEVAFQASSFYGLIDEQLALMGRVIDLVPQDGNSLFESIARQAFHSNITRHSLRNIVCRIGRKYPDMFFKFVCRSEGAFLEMLDEMEMEEGWFENCWFMVAVMLTRILKLEKIVFIRDNKRPIVCPDDGKGINEKSIVVTQSSDFQEYNATKLAIYRAKGVSKAKSTTVKSEGVPDEPAGPSGATSSFRPAAIRRSQKSRTPITRRKKNSLRRRLEESAPYEELDSQLMLIGREQVSIPANNSSAFLAISQQVTDPALTPDYLRVLVYKTGLRMPHLFEHFVEGRGEMLLRELHMIKEENYWDSSQSDLIFSILAVAINNDIVVIGSKAPPQFYPGDALVDDDTVVLVQTGRTGMYFDSSRMSNIKCLIQESEQESRSLGSSFYSHSSYGRSQISQRSKASELKHTLLAPFQKGLSEVRKAAERVRKSSLGQKLRPIRHPDPPPAMLQEPSDVGSDYADPDESNAGAGGYNADEGEDYMLPVPRTPQQISPRHLRPLPPLHRVEEEEDYDELPPALPSRSQQSRRSHR